MDNVEFLPDTPPDFDPPFLRARLAELDHRLRTTLPQGLQVAGRLAIRMVDGVSANVIYRGRIELGFRIEIWPCVHSYDCISPIFERSIGPDLRGRESHWVLQQPSCSVHSMASIGPHRGNHV